MSDNNRIVGQLSAKAKRLEAELQQARMAIKNRGGARNVRKDWLILDNSSQPKEEEETWFATYLDMMTLLLVLLVVMLAFSGKGDMVSGSEQAGTAVAAGGVGSGIGVGAGSGEAKELKGEGDGESEAAGLDNERRLSEMGFNELGDGIDVILNEGTVSFRINSEILFTSGQADLGLEGIGVLKKLVTVLKKNDYQIAVEGHTDSIPIRGRYPSNWELSGSRAGSVVRYFEANGIDSARLRAVGYADTRPLAPNDSAAGRAQNRRVELTMEIPT